MAIQMRRGQSADFVPEKLVPGEWAVSQDNSKIYMCVRPGVVVEIGSSASFEVLVQIAEAWAVGTKNGEPVDIADIQYNNNSKYYAEQASFDKQDTELFKNQAEDSAKDAKNSELQSEDYCNRSETAWNNVDNAMKLITPSMSVDFNTGILSYDGSFFDFILDRTNGHLKWGVAI